MKHFSMNFDTIIRQILLLVCKKSQKFNETFLNEFQHDYASNFVAFYFSQPIFACNNEIPL